MLPGIEKLRRAGDLLRRDGDGSVEPLLDGAAEVWWAMFELPSWPKGLRTAAVVLQSSFFRYRPIRMAVEQIWNSERLQLRRELLRLVDDAERCDGVETPATGFVFDT